MLYLQRHSSGSGGMFPLANVHHIDFIKQFWHIQAIMLRFRFIDFPECAWNIFQQLSGRQPKPIKPFKAIF